MAPVTRIASEMTAAPLHITTPLIPSPAMSKMVGREVLLKLENLQPGGSFKIRGIGETMQQAVRQGVIEQIVHCAELQGTPQSHHNYNHD